MNKTDTPPPLNLTIIQAPLVWADKKANLAYFSRTLAPLSGKTDLIVLPEMFATGFVTEPHEVAEPINGPVMQWMASTASDLGCVVTGSVTIAEKGRYYNRLIWMQPDGNYSAADKRHLFTMGNEHLRFTAGSEPVITELKGWKFKPLVCYDLRFPVWSKNRFTNGNYEYDVLLYVANWPASRSFVWKSLLTARAIENMAYCAGVNRIGDDGHGLPHTGDSCVLDFKGRELVKAPVGEAFIHTTALDYCQLQEFRERFAVGPDWDLFEIKL
ncbi:MAG: amidohydrolase [Bacteroidales bacterium]|nr:amidohydrolase [Bacteroidales bacterium]MBK9357149.1 amidohydrolase [Bacteroidales bacterium]